jgi:hypothetical protein
MGQISLTIHVSILTLQTPILPEVGPKKCLWFAKMDNFRVKNRTPSGSMAYAKNKRPGNSLKLRAFTLVVEVVVYLSVRVSCDSIVLERTEQLRITTSLKGSSYFYPLTIEWLT